MQKGKRINTGWGWLGTGGGWAAVQDIQHIKQENVKNIKMALCSEDSQSFICEEEEEIKKHPTLHPAPPPIPKPRLYFIYGQSRVIFFQATLPSSSREPLRAQWREGRKGEKDTQRQAVDFSPLAAPFFFPSFFSADLCSAGPITGFSHGSAL